MALQLGATREAFVAAGVPSEKASAAAEELAGFEARFSSTDNRPGLIEGRLGGIDGRLNGVDARLTMLTRVMELHAAVTLATFASVFAVWSRPGDVLSQIAGVAH